MVIKYRNSEDSTFRFSKRNNRYLVVMKGLTEDLFGTTVVISTKSFPQVKVLADYYLNLEEKEPNVLP